MLNAYKSYWLNYFNFKSRTSRKTYWLAFLASIIVDIIIAIILTAIFKNNVDISSIKTIEDLMDILKEPTGIINLVWAILNIIPRISIDVRRLHDLNKSGWFIFINLIPLLGPIIYLVWMCSKSKDNNNNYASQV